MRPCAVVPLYLTLPLVSGHFVLQAPTSLGFPQVESLVAQAPCGSFDPTSRASVTDWPLNGGPISILSTDNALNATVFMALVDPATNQPIPPLATALKFQMQGVGNACLPSVAVPANNAALVGMNGFLQVVGDTADGPVFQVSSADQKPSSPFLFSGERTPSPELNIP